MSWILDAKKLDREHRIPLSILGFRLKLVLVSAVTLAFFLATSSTVLAQDDLSSLPLEQPSGVQEEESLAPSALQAEESPAPSAAQETSPVTIMGPTVPELATIGLNFQTSQRAVDSFFIPPDTMGAVGPDHIVEMINGNYEVFDKNTGASLDSRSLDSFWINIAGVPIPPFNDICPAGGGICSVSGIACADNNDCARNGTFDPRIVYDTDSGRWFAASLDRTHPVAGDNNIYVARSDTDDPMGDWDGFLFDADTVAPPEFHDYETLAVDADGLYTCTHDFDSGSGGGGVHTLRR